jgi:hypothetical protein
MDGFMWASGVCSLQLARAHIACIHTYMGVLSLELIPQAWLVYLPASPYLLTLEQGTTHFLASSCHHV